MTLFRLARRLLLCTLVGVIAFGFTGWLLRPKPRWTQERLAYVGFVEADRDWCDDDHIWLRRSTKGSIEVTAISASDGSVLGAIKLPNEPPKRDHFGLTDSIRPSIFGVVRLIDGFGLVVVGSCQRANEAASTDFHVVDPQERGLVRTVSLDGSWALTDGGRKAWQLATVPDGGRELRVADLDTGTITDSLRFGPNSEGLKPATFAVSPDGLTVAAAEGRRAGAFPTGRVEVWDVKRQEIAFRVTMPKPSSAHEGEEMIHVSSVKFEEGGRAIHLSASAISPKRTVMYGRTYDFAQRRFLEYWAPVDFSQDEARGVECLERSQGLELWVWPREFPEPSSYALYRDQGCVIPWRELPPGLTTDEYVSVPQQRSIDDVVLLPSASTFVMLMEEASWTTIAPATINDWLPEGWRNDEPVKRAYWHDWNDNRWREVGCGKVDELQIRPRSLVTLIRNDDGYTLQCWPLPPRDPRPPAIAIAALCSMATWYLRARRRELARTKRPSQARGDPDSARQSWSCSR